MKFHGPFHYIIIVRSTRPLVILIVLLLLLILPTVPTLVTDGVLHLVIHIHPNHHSPQQIGFVSNEILVVIRVDVILQRVFEVPPLQP